MFIKQGELVLRLLVLQRWLEFLTPTYNFSVRACLCFHTHAVDVMLGATVPRVMSESPHKDRSRGVCFLAGRRPQTFCCPSIRPLVLQKHLFSVDQLVGVLPGLAGGGGDGRSSTLTAACSGTGWGRGSASLTETDRRAASLVFGPRRFHEQFDDEGTCRGRLKWCQRDGMV